MKKIIRILGLTLFLGLSLVSCTKEVEVLESSLIGNYKFQTGIAPYAVDLNKNGIKNFDVFLEEDGPLPNTFQFQTGNKVAIRFDGGSGDVFLANYIYDKTNSTITITYSGWQTEVLENVKIGYTSDRKQFLSYTLWDPEVSQIVTYTLVTFN